MTRSRQFIVWFWRGAFALAAAAILTSGAAAQQGDDPFGGVKPLGKPLGRASGVADRIKLTMEVSPSAARRGEIIRVTIRGELTPGFHTYPVTMRSSDPAQEAGQLSKLRWELPAYLRPLWPIEETQPDFEEVPGVGTFLEHRKPFTWSQDVLVMPDAPPGEQTLACQVILQVCDQSCVRGDEKLSAKLQVSAEPAVALTSALQQRLQEREPPLKVIAPEKPAGTSSLAPESSPTNPAPAGSLTPATPESGAVGPPADAPPRGLVALVLASMGAAVAMLLTPCVFPMIPITVSFFLKQSERKEHNALATAAVYSLTIIVVLSAAVLLLGTLIVQLANNAWLNLALGAVLVYFALSLFGMYEIELPAGLARFTSAREGQGGYAGAVFMALTFTVTSFTCTGPFLGPLLVAVKEYQLSPTERLIGALCYAGTFAAPFFVMALFPSLLKKLPKSGGWLNAVKVVMGFLELAAATKFLANADMAWNPGNAIIFNYETVLCSWIALSVACGIYLMGLFRLPHDTPLDHIGVVRMLLASGFLALSLYMAPLLWRVTPLGWLGRGLVGFLPLDTRAPTASARAGEPELAWTRDYEAAWAQAKSQGKLLFIDFTGQNCQNCRYNEKNVFPIPGVRDGLSRYVRVQLYTDYVPDPSLTSSASEAQGRRNAEIQSETFGDISNPLYAVVRPSADAALERTPDGKLKIKGQILGVRKGLISQDLVKDFETFLGRPPRGADVMDAGLSRSSAGAD